MGADVTHPQAGDLLLTRQHVGVLGFTQTVMETRHEQRICRIVVGKVATHFRTELMFCYRRCVRLPYVRNCRIRDDRVHWLRVYWIRVHRIGNNRVRDNRVYWIRVYRIGNDRVRDNRVYRIGNNRFVRLNVAGQIPVFTFLHHVVVIGSGNNTACFFESTVRIASNVNNFNTFNGLRPGSSNIIYCNKCVA